jgi:hypothetical protein
MKSEKDPKITKINLGRFIGAITRSKDPLHTFYKCIKTQVEFTSETNVSNIQVSAEFDQFLHDRHNLRFGESGFSSGMYWLDQSPTVNNKIKNIYEVWYVQY